MNSQLYKVQRKLRGTQAAVAALLGVRQATISDRENGGEITTEAWLALCALPKKRKARRV
jgi:DNA-binding XRE family transcriptional regulator